MRHLFYVHSPIARLMAGAIVAHHDLDPAAVVYLTDRGQVVPGVVALDVSDWQWRPLRGVRHNFALLDRLDAWLAEQFVGAPFTFYLPHHLLPTLRAVTSHPHCTAFHYVEEGLDSYQNKTALQAIHRLRKATFKERLAATLKYRGRIAAARGFYAAADPRFARASGYGLSAETFPDLPDTVVLPPPFPPDARYAGITHVLAPSPESEVGYYPLADQLAVIEGLLYYLAAQNVATLHVKFHPRQLRPGGSAAAFRARFAAWTGRLSIVELPADAVLESVAVSSRASFYVGTSSVGLYAALCGCPAYSYAPALVARNAVYARIADRLPAAFRRLVRPVALPLAP